MRRATVVSLSLSHRIAKEDEDVVSRNIQIVKFSVTLAASLSHRRFIQCSHLLEQIDACGIIDTASRQCRAVPCQGDYYTRESVIRGTGSATHNNAGVVVVVASS